MKKLILLLLLATSALAFGQPLRGTFSYQVSSVSVSFRNDQRTDAPVTVNASSFSPNTKWKWEVYKVTNAFTKTLYATSYEEDPVFNLTDLGYYDLQLTAKNGKDRWEQRWYDAFLVQNPQFTEAQANLVIDITSANYFHDFGNANMSDYKIFVKGTGTHYIQLYQLRATPGHEAIVQSDPINGVNLTTPDGVSHGLWLNQCDNVHVDGFKADGTNGFSLQAITANTAQVIMVFGKNFTNVGIAGVNVYMERSNMTSGSAALAFIPDTPDATYNSSTFLSTDDYVYRCTITAAKDEGSYIFFNNDNLQGSYRPIKSYNFVYSRNTVQNTGRDGGQFASGILTRVLNNYFNTCGLNHTDGQESIISYNGGNAYGLVAGNVGLNSEMIWNVQMGNNPFNKFAGETTPAPSYFVSNYMRVGTHTNGAHAEPDAIYIQNESAVPGTGTWNLYFINNVLFAEDKWNAESYSFTGSSAINHVWINNIIVKSGTNSGRTSPELNYAGPNANQTRTLNNIVRDYPTYSDVIFRDVAANDFSIASLSSVAFAGGPTDVASAVPALSDLLYDNLGFPMFTPGRGYYYGADSPFERVYVAPLLGNLTSGVFISAVNVTSIGETSGTLFYECDTDGQFFWVASTVDAYPSTPQIRAGKLASGSAAPFKGSLIDAGTVIPSIIAGLTESTSYYLFGVFVTNNNIEQSSVTRKAFTTTADLTAPSIGGFTIPDANKNHVNLVSSEKITASTFSHFTLSNPSMTIDSIHIVSGATTGHYLITHTPYIYSDQSPTLSYSGSDNWKDISVAQNSLASFSATSVTNGIAPAPEEAVIWIDGTATPTIVGNNITATANNDNARSQQIVPAASDGYIILDWDAITRSDNKGARAGFGSATAARTFANIKVSMDIRSSNTNIDVYEGDGPGSYKTTLSAINASGYKYKYTISRSVNGGDDKIKLWSSPDGVNYSLKYTQSTTTTGDLRFFVVLGTSGKGVKGALIQANNGLN